jgi:hypothetical protein
VSPHSTPVESARGVGGIVFICDDPATSIVSVPARTVRARSLRWYGLALVEHFKPPRASFPVKPIQSS